MNNDSPLSRTPMRIRSASLMAILMSTGCIFVAPLLCAAPKNLEWRGAVNSTWDTTANTNWFNPAGLTNAPFSTGDIVTFDDTGIGNPVILTNPVEPGSVTVSANTINYTFSGAGSITNLNSPVAGTNVVGLTKNNNGTLTIQTTNTYTGATILNGGIVSVAQLANGGSASAIGAGAAASTNLIFNGGQLQYTGPSVTINRGATLNAGGGTLAVSTAGSILTDSGVIAGPGGLTTAGSGILDLSGANTFSGGTTISSGTVLALSAGATLGSGTIADNGALLVAGSTAINNNISGSGILTNAPGATLLLGGNNASFSGSIYVGTSNLTASTLYISNSTALGANSTITVAGKTTSVLEFVGNTGNGSPATISIPASVGLTMFTGNNLGNREELESGANTYGIWNGPINVKGDGTSGLVYFYSQGTASTPLTINGNIVGTTSFNGGQFIPTGASASDYGVFNGTISINTVDFIEEAGNWTLNSSGNTWGLTWVLQGTLNVGTANALPVTVPVEIGSGADIATLNLNGNNQTVGGFLYNSSAPADAMITNNSPILATLTYSNPADYYSTVSPNTYTNFAGIIGGKLGLNVAAGILNLSGPDTYFGTTTISNGATLALTGNGSIARSANIIVEPNATFSEAGSVGTANNPVALSSAQTLTGVGTAGTLAGNMYMQAGSSLVLNYNGSAPTLAVTNGTFTCTNSGVVTVNVPNSLPVGPSTSYLLVSNGLNGVVSGTVPISVVVNGISDVAGSLAINGAGLVLTVTSYTPKDLEWRGAVSTNWDTSTTNWFDTDLTALDFTNFATLDNVTFDDNAGVTNNLVNLTGMLQPGMVTVSANSTNYTFNGPGGIVGGSGLTLSGNSTLTILTTNSYTGVTTLGAGVLSVNNLAIGGMASAIGAAGSASENVVLNGGELQYTGPSVSIDRGATLGANGGTVAVPAAGAVLTTSGTIAGNNGGGLTVAAGSGVFALAGINSYNGGTTVSAGGTMGLAGGTFGAGIVTNNGTLLFSGVNSVGGDISGPGTLTNAPGGRLTLSGTNTFTGNIYNGQTNLAGTTLIVNNSAALTANNIQVQLNGSISPYSVFAVAPGVTTPTNATVIANPVNGATSRVVIESLPGSSGNCTINGPITINGDTTANNYVGFYAVNGAPLVINGNITGTETGPDAYAAGQFSPRGGAGYQIYFNGTVTLAPAVLFAVNDGAFCTISSTGNSWGVSDLANGELTLGTNNALPVNVPLISGSASSPAILNLNGYSQILGGLSAAGANMLITNNSATDVTLTYSNSVGYYTNFEWFQSGTYSNYIGSIAGNVSLNVAAGILNLGGANTYSGATIIDTNTELMLAAGGSIGDSADIIVDTNAIFAPSGQTLNPGQTLTGAGATGIIGGNFNLGPGSSLVLNYVVGTPTLTVSNSALTLSANGSVTINLSGSPTLSQGSYLLVSAENGGTVSGAPPTSVSINGLANPPNTYGAYLSISGGQLYLNISQSPVILGQFPVTYTNLFMLYQGANPTFSITSVSGAPPFEYEWFTNGVQDGAVTNNRLQLANVQTSFGSDYCVVTNVYGSATSFVWSASVLSDPLNPKGALATYPTNVLALNPIGYWRLNETDDGLNDGNPGALTHDYAGGNDALYTNVYLGQPGYNPNEDPSDTSASFGTFPSSASTADCYAGGIQGIDVSATNGVNGEFTVEAWVNATNQLYATNGIVTKGYFGQEEFSLDAAGPANAFHFEVRNAAGTVYNVNSTVNNYVNGLWYYLAGVCDQANGTVSLYINGALAASVAIPANSGIFNSSSTPMTIGARPMNATSGVTNQFYGNINDVAVFNYALSSNQIAGEYQLAGPFIPTITSQLPITYTNLFTLYAGANPAFTVNAFGTPPISYQWFTNGVADGTATNSRFAMAGVQTGTFSNYCIVTDPAGTATSAVWTASVIPLPPGSSGPPAPYPQSVLALNPMGYWRMNDVNEDGADNGNGDDGYVCHDYAGGNDGMYTNAYIGQSDSYNPITDPSDTSAQFGEESLTDFGDSLAFAIEGINFGSPAHTSVAFTIEAWVSGYQQTSDAGIVTLGWGGGGEQFDLDCGSDSSPTSHGFRFFVRDAGGNVHGVSSTNITTVTGQGPWYHLVGVVDEITNQSVTFYINGQSVGSASLPSGSGILASTYPMGIGARTSAQTSNFNDQFLGNINDVAIFNYALSSSQVANQYFQSGIAPVILEQPVAATNVYQGSTLTVSAGVNGTTPLSFQWYETNLPSETGYALAGQTNLALVINDVQTNDAYFMAVANLFGATNSNPVSVTVVPPPSLNPTNIVFAITNNLLYINWPTNHIGWTLQAQTNRLSVGLSTNWVNVSGSGATNQEAFPLNPANGTVFYRLVFP